MGNLNSIHKIYLYYINKRCLLCKKKTEKHNLVNCHTCHIKLHDYCYDKYFNNCEYTLCPNPKCKKVGTLGQELFYKNKYLEEHKKPQE